MYNMMLQDYDEWVGSKGIILSKSVF